MVAVALLACAIVLAAVTGTSVMIPTLVGSAIGASLVLLLISRDKALEKPEPQVTAPAPEPTTKVCPFCQSEIPLMAKRCPQCTSELPEEEA